MKKHPFRVGDIVTINRYIGFIFTIYDDGGIHIIHENGWVSVGYPNIKIHDIKLITTIFRRKHL